VFPRSLIRRSGGRGGSVRPSLRFARRALFILSFDSSFVCNSSRRRRRRVSSRLVVRLFLRRVAARPPARVDGKSPQGTACTTRTGSYGKQSRLSLLDDHLRLRVRGLRLPLPERVHEHLQRLIPAQRPQVRGVRLEHLRAAVDWGGRRGIVVFIEKVDGSVDGFDAVGSGGS